MYGRDSVIIWRIEKHVVLVCDSLVQLLVDVCAASAGLWATCRQYGTTKKLCHCYGCYAGCECGLLCVQDCVLGKDELTASCTGVRVAQVSILPA